MLFTVDNQTVDFPIDYINSLDTIGVTLSGGTDSALLLHMVAKYTTATILPYCGIDLERPAHIWVARDILDIVRENFPDRKILPFYEFDLDCKDPIWIAKAEAIREPLDPKGSGLVKKVIIRSHTRELKNTGKVDNIMSAITSNPPRGAIPQAKVEERRYVKHPKSTLIHNPFINIDKKWIAGMYTKENILDTIYPLTASCIGFAHATNHFTEPCKVCYWCHEKLWAFNTYDL